MARREQGQGKELTARQMSYEIQRLMMALGPDEFLKVFERSLLGWMKELPEGKRKLKLFQDLYPNLPHDAQRILTRETGFQFQVAPQPG